MNKSLIQILTELVNIKTYDNVTENHNMIDYLENCFKDCVETKKIISESKKCHLLVGINTPLNDLNDCILLSGHIDTIPPSQGHKASCVINGDVAYGLGVSDMKSFIASVIYNIDKIKKCKSPVVLSITSDEEVDFFGILAIIEVMKARKITPGLIIVGEPTDLQYSIANRGNTIFESKMCGDSCHASTPELGINAITLTANYINKLEEINNKFNKNATLCVTSIRGGSVPNIVPDECITEFSVRTDNAKTLSYITKMLQEWHTAIANNSNSTLKKVYDIPPFEKRDNKFARYLSSKTQTTITSSTFTTEAGDLQLAFENAEIFLYGPGNPTSIHKKGEYIDLNKLKQYTDELPKILDLYTQYTKECVDEKTL